jgi:hypothetical protein
MCLVYAPLVCWCGFASYSTRRKTPFQSRAHGLEGLPRQSSCIPVCHWYVVCRNTAVTRQIISGNSNCGMVMRIQPYPDQEHSLISHPAHDTSAGACAQRVDRSAEAL